MRRVMWVLLILAVLAFGYDLFHMAYHLAGTPVLWQLAGVPEKFFVKLLFFTIPLILIFARRIWLSWLIFFLCLTGVFYSTSALAEPNRDCKNARDLMEAGGMARDANENFFGHVQRKPPYGSFPTDMDKITWWGTFQPFEFWESPEFEAVWINPSGEPVAKQKFQGTKCRLAKTSLQGQDQPQGEFEAGMWKVIVTCKDYLIDRQSFAVLPAALGSPQAKDSQTQFPHSQMIWVQDVLKEDQTQ